MKIVDGLRNIISGLGTSRDKASGAQYTYTPMSDGDLLAAYQTSSLIRRAIDLPAEDSCREWRDWQAEADEISKIEAEEKRLGMVEKVLAARQQARLFGGAALVFGTGEGDTSQPLTPEQVKAGGLKYLTVLSHTELSAEAFDDVPSSPYFGQPSMWNAQGDFARIHPSRLVIFQGVKNVSRAYQPQTGWGDSVLQGMMDRLRAVDEVAANVLSLVYEGKVDVMKVPNLMSNLANRGTAYETEVLSRLTLAATGKGINGTLIMDAEEEYEQKTASFSGLDAIMDRFIQLASAASGIPVTLLFGISPGGLNATGDADIRNYYDRVRVQQSLGMTPAMRNLDECLIRSALGDRPEEVHYNWRSLWQESTKEKAENADKITTAAERLYNMRVLPEEAVGQAVMNALTEGGAFPGLEGYVKEFTDPEGGDDDGGDGEGADGEMGITDAAPRTLYVRRDVVNADEVLAWAKAQGFKETLTADDLHVTIAFSKTPLDWMKAGDAWHEEVTVNHGGARLMEQFGDARVLLFASSELSWRHEEIKRAGASWDHPEYQPHITISYATDAPELATVEPYRGRIVLGPEIFEEVNLDWKAKVTT